MQLYDINDFQALDTVQNNDFEQQCALTLLFCTHLMNLKVHLFK